MKKIILILLLVSGCGMYNSDGVYVNRHSRAVQFDTITGQRIIIKYIPVYRGMYSSPYYNHFYDIHRYPRPYRFQYNYPNHFSGSTPSYSNPSSVPAPSHGSTPSVSTPSGGGGSKAGKIQ